MPPSSDLYQRVLLAAAGLLGAAGVAAAAGADHAGDERVLRALALIALAHAPVLLALAMAGVRGTLRFAGAVIASGALVFCIDLAVRHFAGRALLPMAAPAAGLLLIAGWLVLAAAAFAGRGNGR